MLLKKHGNIFFLILTIAVYYILLTVFKLLNNFNIIILIFIAGILGGILLKKYTKSKAIKDLGWGLLYGTLFTICAVIGIFIYLFSIF